MQAVALDDALDAARADGQAGLGELLCDDLGGGVGVEEAVPDGLADGLLGTTVVAAGSGGVVDQGGGALPGEGVAELEVALLGVAEGLGGLAGAKAKALTSDEHGELAGDFVVAGQGQSTGRAE